MDRLSEGRAVFWPDVDSVRRAAWSAEPAWEGGPGLGDLVILLLPALRVLWLQGHQTLSVNFGVGAAAGESTEWRSLDPATLDLTTEPQPFDRPSTGLNVAFDLADVGDATGPAASGYAMALTSTGLGIDEPLPSSGAVPEELVAEVDGFVEAGVQALAALIPDMRSPPPRGDHLGLLWIFDPAHWWGVARAGLAAASALALLSQEPADFIRGQVYDNRRKHVAGPFIRARSPTLGWLLDRPGRLAGGAGMFWANVSYGLQERGESERLTMDDRDRLAGSEHGPSWLDTIVELLATGTVAMDGLVEAADPGAPLEARYPTDSEEPYAIELSVWGRDSIFLVRRTALLGKQTLEGSVAWDYVPGSADQKPRVVLVASRGVGIVDRLGAFGEKRYEQELPWKLEIYRVQDDMLVPSPGERIDPIPILAPAVIQWDASEKSGTRLWTGAYPKLAVKPKPDGAYLEFPIWDSTTDPVGDLSEPEPVDEGTVLPFGLELTVDPLSGTDGYTLDVHYYEYPFFETHRLGGAHVCVLASEGVKIESNGRPIDGLFDFTSQATGTAHPSYWTASAELWEASSMSSVLRPFEAVLPMTDELAQHGSEIGDAVPRTAEGQLVQGVSPTPKHYSSKTFKYEDSFIYDAIDLGVGLIPVVGDAVDIAETAYAWTTGYDKWGRPVSSFQLCLMTVGASVPLLSSAFASKAARGIEARMLHAPPWNPFTRPAIVRLLVEEESVEATLSVSRAWRESDLDSVARDARVEEMLSSVRGSREAIELWTDAAVDATGAEWLSVADILDDSATGARMHSVQAGFLAARRLNSRLTIVAYVELEEAGTAYWVRRAVLALVTPGGVQRYARRFPRLDNFPSLRGRPPRYGVPKLLAEITGQGLLDELTTYSGAALTPGALNMVQSAGLLRPVSARVSGDAGLFTRLAAALLTRLSPGTTLDALTGDVLEPLVGKDKIRRRLISLEERSARLGDALFAADAELTDALAVTDTVTVPAELLLTDRMQPVVAAFVRGFVAEVGREHGLRFELRMAAFFETRMAEYLTTEGVEFTLRHQLAIPALTKPVLKSGPDTVLYSGGRAFLIQLKSYLDVASTVLGPVSVSFDKAGRVAAVSGPPFVRQVILDAARLRRWDLKVPPPGVVWDLVAGPDLSTGVRLGGIHALVLDDTYLRNEASEMIRKAARGKTTARIDDIDAPPGVLAAFKDVFQGDEVDFEDEMELIELTDAWLAHMLPEMQRVINETMADPRLVAALGRRLEYRIFKGTDPVEEIARQLLQLPVRP